jgi:hypothetical protein
MLPVIEDQYDEYVDSKNVYLFREGSDKTSCYRKEAVRKFCFPSGVKIRRIKDDQVNYILNGQPQTYN